MAVQKAELVGDDGFVFDAVVDVEVVNSRIDAQFAMRGAAGSLDGPTGLGDLIVGGDADQPGAVQGGRMCDRAVGRTQ